jgi:hypothetical protein
MLPRRVCTNMGGRKWGKYLRKSVLKDHSITLLCLTPKQESKSVDVLNLEEVPEILRNPG